MPTSRPHRFTLPLPLPGCAVPRAMAMRLVTLVQMGGTCPCAGPHHLRGVSTGAPSSARRCSLTVVALCLLHVACCLLHVARLRAA